MYKRLCRTLSDKGTLYPIDTNFYEYTDQEKDWYISLYDYNDSQWEKFCDTGTVKGIQDVSTTKLLWDFDNKDDIEAAKLDAAILCTRLINLGIKDDDISISFSGNKGFGVEVNTDRRFTVEEFKAYTFNLAGDLPTFDRVVNNANRIIRMLGTRHQVSGLFKIPLTFDQLNRLSVKEIQSLAANLDNITEEFNWGVVSFPKLNIIVEKKETKPREILNTELDFTHKPKFLTNCRWALQNGYFQEGMRSNALLCLAATYKNLGYDMEITYRMLKGVCELQAKRNECDRFPDEELYNNVVLQVYSDYWNNGQYSCREEGSWLHDYCQSLGEHKCDHGNEEAIKTISASDTFDLFKSYTENFETNVLYTGIKSLDEKCKFLVGTSNGILAPPSLGKTSTIVQILNHNSNEGIQSIFFSYDMFHSALYMRMVQRHTGMTQDEIYNVFKNDPKQSNTIKEMLQEEYKNVHFCFRSGQTLDELERTILDVEEKTGKKVKLVAIDYNELIISGVSDDVASSAHVAQSLRRIANEREVCSITLVQPSKVFSTPADEIVNFNAVKGSSSIAQSMTVLLGCSRPGYNPRNNETDKFFNITCLKNRNGPLFTLDFGWNGLRGRISELTELDRRELEEIRALREIEKKAKEKW